MTPLDTEPSTESGAVGAGGAGAGVIMMLVCGACTLGGVDCSNYVLFIRFQKEVPLVWK